MIFSRFSINGAVRFTGALLFLASLVSIYVAVSFAPVVALAFVAGVNIFAVSFLVFSVTRGFLLPLREIRNLVAGVKNAGFSGRVKEHGSSEMRDLARAFNIMMANAAEAQEKEREIERMKTEFVSLAAHQLRNPLSVIRWTLQVMLEGDYGPVPKKQRELLQKTFESNESMIRLINDLLDVSRIEEGRYLYEPAFKDIVAVVNSMADKYKEEAERRGVALLVQEVSGGVPLVYIDEEKIRLAIQNLLENALRYTPRGGRVTIELSHDTKEVRVAVRDTGMGIPESQQRRVFQKFFRATNAKSLDSEGSGLGLYLVKNIIQAHGGSVEFQTQEGKGSVFTLRVPLGKIESAPDAAGIRGISKGA
ncbi:MAG: HAMP domain-containing histidine kinase [Candidatus Wildermuthbacteria bacterium]|nr:HAMP domain-containing histidine kinase [Candidatus Wildermuthbacteria bacterium]